MTRRFPRAQIVAVDWAPVLAVARKRAEVRALNDRIILMPGDAFEIDFGHNYDVVLVPNFFHHFNEATNVEMMKKIAAALKPNGQIIIVEFVPNEDRVSPPLAARFAFTMLTTTAEGDAYTLSAFTRMLDAAGFKVDESRPLLPTPLTAISARKR